MRPNPGHLPREAIGKRVLVTLAGDKPGTPPRNWPADGPHGCCWQPRGNPADIASYAVVG